MIDFEAGLDVLNGFARPGEQFHVAAVREILAAVLGDEPLYSYVGYDNDRHLFERQAQGLAERVWPVDG